MTLAKSDTIDRISPTRRPEGRAALRQRWSELLFLHWAVPAETLRPMLPPGLELDTYEERAYVGLIFLTVTGARPLWAPALSPLSNFYQVNLRTYVHRDGRDPGVWFFSQDASNALAAQLGHALYKLPYHAARLERRTRPASLLRSEKGEGDTVEYWGERLSAGRTPVACSVRAAAQGMVCPAKPGTQEHFLAERYIFYTYHQKQLYAARIYHPTYPLQAAEVSELEESLLATAGIARPAEAPIAHFAKEVQVEAFPRRLAR